MNQNFIKNTKYKIKTPNGWEDFKGIIKNDNVEESSSTIFFDDNTHISATNSHKFFIDGKETQVKDLSIGDTIDSKDGFKLIVDIKKKELKSTYEIFDSESHKILVNDIVSHQCDEFAFVKPHLQEEFWDSVLPTLSTGGACIISSTPNGDINKFAQLWRGAVAETNEFVPVHIKWDQPPGRDEKFKVEKIGLLGELKWRQEYECEFLSTDAILIDTYIINQAENKIAGLEPAFTIEEQDFWEKINPHGTYLLGVDPATGTGADFSVITVYDFPSLRQVMEFRSNTMSSPFLYNYLKKILHFLTVNSKEVYFSIENNGVGNGLLSLYENDFQFPDRAHLVSENGGMSKLGMTTTAPTKMKACLRFKNMFESNNITVKSIDLLKELKSYKRKRGAYEAETGATDDSISASLIIMRIIEEMAEYDELAYHKLYTSNIDFDSEWGDKDENYTDDNIPPPFII